MISRWEPTSKICSCCGFKGGKFRFINILKWECFNCGAKHDRDENAARNILVAGGHTETLNGQVDKQPD
ncbi:MAG: transposase [Trichodesmium sp. MAG_R02]|nr:transposase [Trichodesmium sp. MAG_R02]